jgi:hypothetical protein
MTRETLNDFQMTLKLSEETVFLIIIIQKAKYKLEIKNYLH